MCAIFDKCEDLVQKQKSKFMDEIDEIIQKQSAIFNKDNKTKVPKFYERLSQKYAQLKEATEQSAHMPEDQIVEILK